MTRIVGPALVAAAIAVLGTATSAAAAPSSPPSGTYAWIATAGTPPPSSPATRAGTQSPAAQHLRKATDSAAVRVAAADDLKTDCQNHRDLSGRQQGWARSRFEQCFIGSRTVNLINKNSGVVWATIDFDYSLLGFTVDGSRRIDYVFAFDRFDTKGGEPLPETILTVDFNGCANLVVCSENPTLIAQTVPDWKTGNRTYQFSVTSPDNTGGGTFAIVRSLISMDMSVVTETPEVSTQWTESGMAESRARFDSAGSSLGQGKFNGAVFSDNVPVLDIDRSATSPYPQEARHVDDALNNPARTFPSFVGKSVPGQGARPLHRLMNTGLQNANHNGAVQICKAVWGPNYTSNGTKECDEYPYRSTYEGSAAGTGATVQNPAGGNPNLWNGSARPISAADNGAAGVALGLFYGQNRVLDENVGTPQEGAPSDPFTVLLLP